MKELTVEARIENLETVLNFVADELEAADCGMKLQTQITVSAEEIFVNIANYAYSPKTGSATVRVTVGDEAAIEFEDRGKPYNPLEKGDPDITSNAEERDIGGLGIFIVKQMMDAVEYRNEDGKNILVIKKSLT